MRRRGRYLQEAAGSFPVIPMIDVMLNLLIFFMLISHYLPAALSVTLPKADSSAPTDAPAVSITIDAQGKLQVDGVDQTWDRLPGLLDGRGGETEVHIAADEATRYDFIVRALDAAGLAGLPHVALETRPGV